MVFSNLPFFLYFFLPLELDQLLHRRKDPCKKRGLIVFSLFFYATGASRDTCRCWSGMVLDQLDLWLDD